MAILGQPGAIFGYPNRAIFPDRRYVQDSTGLGRLVRKSEEKKPKKLRNLLGFRRSDSQRQLRIAFLGSGQLWIVPDSSGSYLVIRGQLRELSGYLRIAKDSSGSYLVICGQPKIAPGAIWLSADSSESNLVIRGQLRELSGYLTITRDSFSKPSIDFGQFRIAFGQQRQLQTALGLSKIAPDSFWTIKDSSGQLLGYQRQFRLVFDSF